MLRVKRTSVVLDMLVFGMAAALFLSSAVFRWMGEGYITTAFYLMMFGIIALDVGAFLHSAFHIYRDVHFLLFVFAYNLLLLGRVYFNSMYFPHKMLVALEADSWDNLYTALTVVATGLLAFIVFYYAAGPLFAKYERQIVRGQAERKKENGTLPVIRQLSKIMLYASSIPYFYTMALKVLTVLKNGYSASFTDTMEIPGIISRLSAVFVPSFAVFLGTLPSVKEMKLPLLVYGVYMVASLFTGRRNMLVTEALMLLVYFVMRDFRRAKGKRRITKKVVAFCGIGGVLGAYLLQMMAYKRAGNFILTRSFGDVLMSFVDSQGASFRVVIQTVNNMPSFDQNITWLYLLYPFELFAHNNLVIRNLFGLQPIVEVQNEGFAKSTHNFAHVLTYKVDPQRYEGGGGFGTSFIAESYVAGGIAAVILLAIMAAVLFRFLSSILAHNWVVIAFGMLAFRQLIYLPRSFAFTWATETFSITNIVYFAALYAIALLIIQISAKVRPRTRAPSVESLPDSKSPTTEIIGG